MGAPLPNPDIYVPPGQTGATGYNPATDVGIELVLKPSSQNEVSPSFYNAWDISGITGANAYSANISTCNSAYSNFLDNMLPETGNMVGPTTQGVNNLIALDPNATWDPTCNNNKGCVSGSAYRISPRVRALPVYNPVLYAMDQHSGKSWPQLQLVNYIGFFIENLGPGGAVTGRICPIVGGYNPNVPMATGGFAQAIVLVK
jgi:hypothetical protein